MVNFLWHKNVEFSIFLSFENTIFKKLCNALSVMLCGHMSDDTKMTVWGLNRVFLRWSAGVTVFRGFVFQK